MTNAVLLVVLRLLSLIDRARDSVAYRTEMRRWNQRVRPPISSIGVGGSGTVFVDVFDTVLIRRVVGEPGPSVVARSLGSIGDRYVWRRAVAGQRHENILDIATDVARDLDNVTATELIEREIEAEFELCVGVPGASDWLKSLRRAGKKIIFVSDMHLPTEVISGLLRKNDLLSLVDEVVVSADWGATKRSGRLIPAVLEKFGLSPEGVTHVGNDLVTDGAMPRVAGLDVLPSAAANLTPYERIAADADGQASAIIAGASRLARLRLLHRSDFVGDPDLLDLATGVGGTVGVAFVLWVLDRARDSGCRRLYFVARDGEIFLEIARALPNEYTEGLELRYLHANRRSVSLAHAAVVGVAPWIALGTASPDAQILNGRERVPWANLCGRVGLSPEQLALHSHDLGDVDPQRPLPGARVSAFLEALGSTEVQALIAQEAHRRHSLVGDYFDSVGLGDDGCALVDVGWTGQLSEAIASVARSHDPGGLHSYHFGSLPITPGPSVPIESFLGSEPLMEGAVVCVETFTASNTAPVVEFSRQPDGKVLPVFDDADFSPGAARELIRAGMIESARNMPPPTLFDRWGGADTGTEPVVRAILRQLWLRPRRSDALALAPLLFESDDAGRVVSGLAEPMRLVRDSRRRVWGPGSVAVSGGAVRLVAFARRQLAERA